MDRAEICRCNFTEPEKSRYNEIIYQDCAPLCANHAQHLAVSADKIDIVTGDIDQFYLFRQRYIFV